MASFWRVAASRSAPLVTAVVALGPSSDSTTSSSSRHHTKQRFLSCDAATAPPSQPLPAAPVVVTEYPSINDARVKPAFQEGMQADAQGMFHDLFPQRQLFIPALPYPLWNTNWDGLQPESTGDDEEDRRMMRRLRKKGVTRHIILVRHGQYDETFKEDEKRILTPLGREQAHLTGKRIAEMMHGAEELFGPCKISALRVSGLTRAIETAEIIASHLPGVGVEEHDTMLNEGRCV